MILLLCIILFFLFLIVEIAKSKKWCYFIVGMFKKLIKKRRFEKMKDFKELIKKLLYAICKKEYIILKKLYK